MATAAAIYWLVLTVGIVIGFCVSAMFRANSQADQCAECAERLTAYLESHGVRLPL